MHPQIVLYTCNPTYPNVSSQKNPTSTHTNQDNFSPSDSPLPLTKLPNRMTRWSNLNKDKDEKTPKERKADAVSRKTLHYHVQSHHTCITYPGRIARTTHRPFVEKRMLENSARGKECINPIEPTPNRE
ncbi:uncharacterized protein UTRI_05131 [Ustilago trichophora]|uniref:Uncharacterized protein n=1 Tax=Ustilago trichophora TaxID=86804 RepID=A0A5C3EC37_9BASI|nr:uncharacterized protein UTRI_05131 [Ustilago trichophora]